MVIMKKVILMVFLIFSLLMIVYGIGFILNYYLVIKYSIEDCLPLGGKGTFPVVSDRLDEKERKGYCAVEDGEIKLMSFDLDEWE